MVIGVDEATNFYFIGFHKTKDTISQTLFDTITKIDKVRGVNTVKTIHSDGGSEFVSKDTAKWCADRGIACTWSAARTPEHNGVAERAIQSVVSSARCMAPLGAESWSKTQIHQANSLYALEMEYTWVLPKGVMVTKFMTQPPRE